jgi:hypothetical protein
MSHDQKTTPLPLQVSRTEFSTSVVPGTVLVRRWRTEDAERCRLCEGGCSAQHGPDGQSVCTIIIPDKFPTSLDWDLALFRSRESICVDPETRAPRASLEAIDWDLIDGEEILDAE